MSKALKRNEYSIYYDHVGYTMVEWELPADIEVDPTLGFENYDAMEWGIEHGVFDLIPIAEWDDDGNPLDADREQFDEYCIESSLFTDKGEYAGYVIPFYEFKIMKAGESPYVHKLEELVGGKPNFREE